MSKVLQYYIDEAKRNSKSTHTGWSITLLGYVDKLEKEINKLKNEINKKVVLKKIPYDICTNDLTGCPYNHITKGQKNSYDKTFSPIPPYVNSFTCQECEFYHGELLGRNAIICAHGDEQR